MKFKGHDWEELADYWKIQEDDDRLGACKSYISSFISRPEKIASQIREFLKALTKESKKVDYQYPIWKALSKIENDKTLLIFTIDLLQHMWT